ncbi:MAG: DegV family protein [Erysipelotrichaceae bacterium]|nr:DegV family protein [Erysipelotrichaceae bacterium]
MRNFVIVVDSCSDLSKDLRVQYQIEYVKMNIIKKLPSGDVEIPASLDWDLYTNKELFDWQRNGMKLKTTQVPHDEFYNMFEKLVSEGNDVLYIACSSALSGSYNYSLIVRDEILKKYPDARIECVDSLTSSMGEGSMAIDVAKLKASGKTLDECLAYLNENKLCYNQVATVENLQYLKDAGRVKASAAFFGTLFSVKPLIISDAIGQNYAIKKAKGRKTSLVEVVNLMKENIEDANNQTVWIVHADCLEDAMKLKEIVEKEINPKEVRVEYLGPIIGVSTGPGTLGLFAKGKKVTIVGK